MWRSGWKRVRWVFEREEWCKVERRGAKRGERKRAEGRRSKGRRQLRIANKWAPLPARECDRADAVASGEFEAKALEAHP